MNVYQNILDRKSTGKKQFAILIDPDKCTVESAIRIANLANKNSVDYIFIGGSLLTNGNLHECIKTLKANCSKPVVLFPGNTLQIDEHADAILFLSLISGRNAELLIGKHVIAAPILKEKKIETISCGYMLIESGNTTTALYMSNTHPIPHHKNDIAACTALAGEMLGLKLIYMDAGSGAQMPVTAEMIRAVRNEISLPIIVGGGIKTPEQVKAALKAGADMIVVGNAIEKDEGVIGALAGAVSEYKK
ncbi:MAG: geranylgeranylglyceryl/heptaprenylglyceryl phosphate synthase [Bacteroidia bacterium]